MCPSRWRSTQGGVTCSVPVVPVHLFDGAAETMETAEAFVVPFEATWHVCLLDNWVCPMSWTR